MIKKENKKFRKNFIVADLVSLRTKMLKNEDSVSFKFAYIVFIMLIKLEMTSIVGI